MNLKNHLLKLLSYDLWANLRVLECVKDGLDDNVSHLISHIINADEIWYGRMAGSKNLPNVFDTVPTEQWGEKLTAVNNKITDLLASTPDEYLNKMVQYKNSKGVEFENSVSDIVTHKLNHSTYHRAQVCSLIRNCGGSPPVTDYIAFVRM